MTKRFVGKAVAAATLAVGLAMVSQTAAFADASVSVTPSSGLSNGASVSVSVTGVPAGSTWRVAECAVVAAPDVVACNGATTFTFTANGSGSGGGPLTVNSSFVGTKLDGTTQNVSCAATPCFVAVGNDAGEGAGVVGISFS